MPMVLVVNPNTVYKVQNMAQNTLLASMNTGFGVHTTTFKHAMINST